MLATFKCHLEWLDCLLTYFIYQISKHLGNQFHENTSFEQFPSLKQMLNYQIPNIRPKVIKGHGKATWFVCIAYNLLDK